MVVVSRSEVDSPTLVGGIRLEEVPLDDLDYTERNRIAWEHWAPGYARSGRRAWRDEQLVWGIWGTPESSLGLLEGLDAGADAVELGCGTGAVCASLARLGLRPVAVDIAKSQLRTVEDLQRETDIWFRLECANGERLQFDDESFDVVISEYGTSLWCDPRRWLPEAARLLRPNGRLVFFTNGVMLMACTPENGGPVGTQLVRDYFSMYRIEFSERGPVEFHPTHSQWIQLLRANGLTVDDMIEPRPLSGAIARFDLVSSEWARNWPSEEIWIAGKRA